ncbi:MAG: hypothetical protein M3235_15930, partial [Actinomycetota bacterium]|nr:hypothetical protein [Actinomycetota bacterium]
MTRTRRLRPSRALAGTVGALALAGSLALSGCGAGQLSQTSEQGAAVNGTNARQGDVFIRDMQIVYPQRPASPEAPYPRGAAAPLRFGIVNEGPVADRLVRVSSPIATAVTINGDASLPQNILLLGGGEGGTAPAGVRPVTVELTGLTRPIQAGVSVPVTLTFERAGSTTVQAPVGAPPEGGSGSEPEREDAEGEGEHSAPEAEGAQP